MNATVEPEIKNAEQQRKIKLRRTFVQRAKFIGIAMLTFSWLSHSGNDAHIAEIRHHTAQFMSDSMHYDLLTHGTATSPFVSSSDEIARKWNGLANAEASKWRDEDNSRLVNYLFLLSFTGLAAWCLLLPSGHRAIEAWIVRE